MPAQQPHFLCCREMLALLHHDFSSLILTLYTFSTSEMSNSNTGGTTLVRYQDQGIGDEKAYVETAKKFSLTVEQVRKIAIEGVMKNWPMP
ncbi:MAG TPA: hypothetical protein ENN65_01655 [Candidatus Hydrogenedentes bacterium]|nr:hypothetical protein [Candidatus Hydrogenedentota bacterium]